MKLACFENEAMFRQVLAGLDPEPEVDFYPGPLTSDLEPVAYDYRVITITPNSVINGPILARLPSLKMVLTTSTGFDHIDTTACAKAGVAVCHIPSWAENAVAEHTLALMLSLARRIPESVVRTRDRRFGLAGLRGFELAGRRLGVIGAGSIGRKVIRLGLAVGMEVAAHDARPDAEAARTMGFSYQNLDDLLTASDVVSLHLPALPGTGHLIGRREMGLMKPGAILINTSRGENVSSAALLEGLESGRLAGAGLDVLEEVGVVGLGDDQIQQEPGEVVEKLLAREDVIVTPHSAWFTGEASARVFEAAGRTIAAWLAGEPINLVPGT